MEYDSDKVCRCVISKTNSSINSIRQECMGPNMLTAGAEHGPGHKGVKRKGLKSLHNILVARGRERADRLPLLSHQTSGCINERESPVKGGHQSTSSATNKQPTKKRGHTHSKSIRSPSGFKNVSSSQPSKGGSGGCLQYLMPIQDICMVPPMPSLRVAIGALDDDDRSERYSCFSEEGNLLISSESGTSFQFASDSRGSVDCMNSVGAFNFEGGQFPPQGKSVRADRDTIPSNEQVAQLGIVERTLFESWKVLPWQARLCPKAIEELGDIRRASALKREAHRVQTWRQTQQTLASNAAQKEESLLAGWWKKMAEELWELERERRRSREQLAAHHEAQLADLENQRTVLLSVGYGEELAVLDSIDQSEHLDRQKHIEKCLSFITRIVETGPSPDSSNTEVEDIDTLVQTGTQEIGSLDKKIQHETVGVTAQISMQTQGEFTRATRHASSVVLMAEVSCRRRQSLVYLIYRGLAAVYSSARIRARRLFVSECAADIAHINFLASVGQRSDRTVDDEISPEEAWNRERRRVWKEINPEKKRVACWMRLQREVLRGNAAEVLRILTVDHLRQETVDGGRRWPMGCSPDTEGGSGGPESKQSIRKRARGALRELKRREVKAQLEAENVQRSWMAALESWKKQLERARSKVVKAEADELRVLQKEAEETFVARDHLVYSSLARRSEALAQSWKGVLDLERSRINDAVESWRASFLATSGMLKKLKEESQRERLRRTQWFDQEMCRESDGSKRVLDLIDQEEAGLAEEQSSLVIGFAKIVADTAAAEIEATTVARQDWWKEAREGVLRMFSATCLRGRSSHGWKSCEGGNSITDSVNVGALETTASSPLLLSRLDGMIRAEKLRTTDAAVAAVNECGPLHLVVEEKQLRNKQALERCLGVVEAAYERPSCESFELEAIAEKIEPASEVSAKLWGKEGDIVFLEELDLSRSKVETHAVQQVAASFEDDIKRLAVEGKIPPRDDRPIELTRAQLDLRRAARIAAQAKALGEMLFQARKALLKKTFEATEMRKEEYYRGASIAESRHVEKIGHLKYQAWVEGDGALSIALSNVKNCLQGISTQSSAIVSIRRHVLGLVVKWLDQVATSELKISELWQNELRNQDVIRTASLEEFNRSVYQEQQDCARCIRESDRRSLETARIAVTDYIAEAIRQQRQGTDRVVARQERGGSSSGDGGTTIPKKEFKSETETHLSMVAGDERNEGAARCCRGGEAEEVKEAAGGSADGEVGANPFPQIPHQTNPLTPPLLDKTRTELLALQATAHASLLSTIEKWERGGRFRAQAFAKKIVLSAASAEDKERQIAEDEEKTLRLAFNVAKNEADQAFAKLCGELPEQGECVNAEPRGISDNKIVEESENAGTCVTCSRSEVEQMPNFIAEERKECADLWSALEQSLSSRLEVATQRECIELKEEAKSVRDKAMAYVADLESNLRGILAEITARVEEEVDAVIRGGSEKLKLAFVTVKEGTALALAGLNSGSTSGSDKSIVGSTGGHLGGDNGTNDGQPSVDIARADIVKSSNLLHGQRPMGG